MHELSICSAIRGIVERQAAGRPVRTVCLEVGELRQVVPETLDWYWTIAVQGTPLAGAALAVTAVPVVVECKACGQRTALELPLFRCGACAGTDVVVRTGDELQITALVLQEA